MEISSNPMTLDTIFIVMTPYSYPKPWNFLWTLDDLDIQSPDSQVRYLISISNLACPKLSSKPFPQNMLSCNSPTVCYWCLYLSGCSAQNPWGDPWPVSISVLSDLLTSHIYAVRFTFKKYISIIILVTTFPATHPQFKPYVIMLP